MLELQLSIVPILVKWNRKKPKIAKEKKYRIKMLRYEHLNIQENNQTQRSKN